MPDRKTEKEKAWEKHLKREAESQGATRSKFYISYIESHEKPSFDSGWSAAVEAARGIAENTFFPVSPDIEKIVTKIAELDR